MKVETPQILWHSEEDKGINAALTSVSLLESGITGNVLATSANSNQVHLWKLTENDRTKVDHLCSFTRHDGPVNAVAFSPDGLHLATASETGTLIVWSVPLEKRGNGNGRHFWATLTQEKDVNMKILHAAGDGLTDLDWSRDSKRFCAGSIDHSVFICELTPDGNWRIVFKNGVDHSHYVQGVTYDPLGVYLGSMSSDRSIRLFTRKCPKGKKKLLKPAANTQPDVQVVLSDTKLEMGVRSKELRRWRLADSKLSFCDESTLQSFVRRLSWTTDGAYLVAPAAVVTDTSSYATLMFNRHSFDEPCRVLGGLEKPSVAVVPNPVLFCLPEDDPTTKAANAAVKENEKQSPLPYRSLFCVLTWDTVYVYDTVHLQPLSVIKGLHYANLVDATWSADGHTLAVCSTDGYVSFVKFSPGELGQIYRPKPEPAAVDSKPEAKPAATKTTSASPRVAPVTAKLPPTEPGTAVVLEARPKKKARLSSPPDVKPAASEDSLTISNKRSVEEEVDSLTINELVPKKKKRIQPVLLAP